MRLQGERLEFIGVAPDLDFRVDAIQVILVSDNVFTEFLANSVQRGMETLPYPVGIAFRPEFEAQLLTADRARENEVEQDLFGGSGFPGRRGYIHTIPFDFLMSQRP